MSEYLVVIVLEHNIRLYRVSVETPQDAIDNSLLCNPFKEYYIDSIYGDGAVAIPYSTANVILTYVKLFFAKAEVKPKKESEAVFVGFRNPQTIRNFNVVQ